jgi:hypothetical protein
MLKSDDIESVRTCIAVHVRQPLRQHIGSMCRHKSPPPLAASATCRSESDCTYDKPPDAQKSTRAPTDNNSCSNRSTAGCAAPNNEVRQADPYLGSIRGDILFGTRFAQGLFDTVPRPPLLHNASIQRQALSAQRGRMGTAGVVYRRRPAGTAVVAHGRVGRLGSAAAAGNAPPVRHRGLRHSTPPWYWPSSLV